MKTEYKADGSITDQSHPVFRPHLLQGWTPDFVPRMVEHATEHDLYDELDHVSGEEAVEMAKLLARSEGHLYGDQRRRSARGRPAQGQDLTQGQLHGRHAAGYGREIPLHSSGVLHAHLAEVTCDA